MLDVPGSRIIIDVRPIHFGADAVSILQQIYQRNRVWIAAVVLGGKAHGLHACVTSLHTNPTDVDGFERSVGTSKGVKERPGMIRKRIAVVWRLPWAAVLFLCIGCNGRALPLIIRPTALPTTPGSTPSTPATARLAITSFFSAETVYEKIEIRDRRLIYTTFADKEQQCAQSMAQAPCWREEDLTTRAAMLSPNEEQAFIDLLAQVGFWGLEDTYGAMQSGQRFYPYRLSVRLGAKEKEVVYQSAPEATPMPAPLRQVMDQLDVLVKTKFR